MRGLLRRPARLWRVITMLIAAFVLPSWLGSRRSRPVRMRQAFEELGGAWIKLGQMLAMRFDLLPPEYSDELLKLLNAVAPFGYDDVVAIVRQELGGAPDSIFDDFERVPFASASIGQVHRARLKTGEPVAVKVQRPAIRETMQTDISLMYTVASLLDFIQIFGATNSRDVIDEFARWTADELDYMVEARQSVLLYEHARDEPLEHVARIYRGYTTSRVLTSELLTGIPLVDIVAAVRANDQAYLTRLASHGYNVQSIVRHLDWNMLNQVYVFGYFHADLHPANLYVLPGNAIGYVDFGIVGQLPDNVRDSLTRYSWLLFQWDVGSAVRELMRWLAPSADTNIAQAQRELTRLHETFLFEIGDIDRSGASGADRAPNAANPYSKLAMDILQAVRANQLSLSPSIVAYLKMLTTLGALRHQLALEYDLPGVARQFFVRLIQQKGEEWLDPRLMLGRAYATTYRIGRALEFVDFLEEQQPVLASLIGLAFGSSLRLKSLYRKAVGLGAAILVVGAMLYLVLAQPGPVRATVGAIIPFDLLQPMLIAVMVVLTVGLIDNVRRLGQR